MSTHVSPYEFGDWDAGMFPDRADIISIDESDGDPSMLASHVPKTYASNVPCSIIDMSAVEADDAGGPTTRTMTRIMFPRPFDQDGWMLKPEWHVKDLGLGRLFVIRSIIKTPLDIMSGVWCDERG